MLPESSSVYRRFGSTLVPEAETRGTFEIDVTSASAGCATSKVSSRRASVRFASFARWILMIFLPSRAACLLEPHHRLHDGHGIARSHRLGGDPVVDRRRL